MLPAGNRLSSSDHIKRIQRTGVCLRGALMTLCYIRTEESRFAVVVGQKTSRSAVARTRVKRQVRGALTHAMKSLKTPVHGVIMTRAAIVAVDSSEIRKEMDMLVAKIL